MQHRETIARGIWYLAKREYWSLSRIRDFTDVPVKDIPQLINEGSAYVLSDKVKQ